MKYSIYTKRKIYSGGKSKKCKGSKKKSKKKIRRGHTKSIGLAGHSPRAVTRRYNRTLQKKKGCMSNWVDVLYNLGKARQKVDVLLQRINLVKSSGKYVPDREDHWKMVINLKRRKYRFNNISNLKKEEIDPVQGEIWNQLYSEMEEILPILEKDQIKDNISSAIDRQDFIEAARLFNNILKNFAYDDTYVQITHGLVPLSVDWRRDYINTDKEEDILGTEYVPPISIKKNYTNQDRKKLALLLNNSAEISGESAVGEEQQRKAEEHITWLCVTKIIGRIKSLIKIYEDQFISLISFLPNYMFNHDEALKSSQDEIEYDITDADIENTILSLGEWSDVEESDEDVEDMGETDGDDMEEELEVGGPDPYDPVPDDF